MDFTNSKVLILVGGALTTLVLIASIKWLVTTVRYVWKKQTLIYHFSNLHPGEDYSAVIEANLDAERMLPENFFDLLIENSVHPLVVASIIGTFESFTILNFIVTVVALFLLMFYEFYLLQFFLQVRKRGFILCVIWVVFYLAEVKSYTDQKPEVSKRVSSVTSLSTDSTATSHKKE